MAAIDRINNIVAQLEKDFGVTVLSGKPEEWAAELESGTGRTYAELREDIYLNYVGMDDLTAFVQGQFDSRGIPLTEGTDETADERLARIVNELVTGQRTFASLGDSLDKAVATKEEAASQTGITDSATGPTGMPAGGTFRVVKSTDTNMPDRFAMVYQVGDMQHVYFFDSRETAEAALGDLASAGGGPPLLEEDLNNGNIWVLGSAEGLAADAGDVSYQGYFDRVMSEAALNGGSRDPGKLGQIMSDPQVQAIMAEAAIGGWENNTQRIWAEIRNRSTAYYEVYPGIDKIIKAGSGNPEADWRNYSNDVESGLRALGYEPDANGAYDSYVGEMLDAGIATDEFAAFVPTYVRASQSEEFAAALSPYLGYDASFDDVFDILAGTSTPELDAAVEQGIIQFQANMSNTTLSEDQVRRLSELTQFTEQQVALAFSQAEEALLSVGQADLDRYGLTQEALVNAAFGVDTEGTTAQQVRRQAQKAATELGIQDDRKGQFFVGFDSFGRPRRQGLGASAPESG